MLNWKVVTKTLSSFTAVSFALGVIESALYGAWAGFLYSALYNCFGRRADRALEHRAATARAA